jgi:LPS-assembly protein
MSKTPVLVRSSEFVVRSKIFEHRTPNTGQNKLRLLFIHSQQENRSFKGADEQRSLSISLWETAGFSPRSFICSAILFLNLMLCAWNLTCLYAQEKKEPIVVNGDQVEYSADNKEITATGKVEVIYKDSKLTCQKLTVNTQTKEGVAEGMVILDDRRGIIKGSKIIYNFDSKTGTIFDSNFRANPYFGKSSKVQKVSEDEFIAVDGFVTTCNFDRPHYRIGSKQINMFPKDKMQTKDNIIYIGGAPVLYLPRYNHSLKDPMMHIQVMPGKNSDWGPYLLTSYRHNLSPNLDGRIYLDYRNKLGLAEGFGLNYTNPNFGTGDYKFYYTNEKPNDLDTEFERYLIRWRHKWSIDPSTNFSSEAYKIVDKRRKIDSQRSFLKDYFYREFEQDSQPLTYALLHHSFQYSSMDLLAQKRINSWFDQIDKLPELKYSLPNLKVGDAPFYLENSSSFSNFGKKASTAPVSPDEVNVTRLDTLNKISLPTRVAFVEVAPFVADRFTLYDRGANDESLPIRTIFYSGVDLSTKFYRIYNVRSNFLKMNLDGLRHIITPTIGYSYNHEPTIPASNLYQIDSVDAITSNSSAAVGLTNKLQTKRLGKSVDLMDCLVTSSYIFKPKTGEKRGSNFSDILINIKLLPYSWMRMQTDALYKHSGSRLDRNYGKFSNANYDINFDLGKERFFGLGQRYQRQGGNEITASLYWRLSPKWKFSVYQRYNLKQYLDSENLRISKGSLEQQYTISRDLHCWNVEVTFNTKRDEGSTVYFVFRLKAFPEMEFGFNQSYHKPQAGSQ